jgi:hypothetical protein
VTDDFNETARRILRDSEGNGGLTIRSLFDLVVASHEESVATAARLAEKVEAAALLRMTEREELHIWQMQQAERCAAEHKKLLDEEFARLKYRAPRRKDDPPDHDFVSDPVALAFSGGYEREQYEKEVRGRFLSKSMRYIIVVIVVLLLLSLVYAFAVRHDDLQSDIATGLSSTIAVAMLIWAMLRKEK